MCIIPYVLCGGCICIDDHDETRIVPVSNGSRLLLMMSRINVLNGAPYPPYIARRIKVTSRLGFYLVEPGYKETNSVCFQLLNRLLTNLISFLRDPSGSNFLVLRFTRVKPMAGP